MTKSKILMAGMMFLGLLPASAWASLLTVKSYSIPNGAAPPQAAFPEDDYTYSNCPASDCTTTGALLSGGVGRLTNGVIPTTDYNVNSNSADWIDWANGLPNATDPTMTAYFAGNATINAVSVVFDNCLGGGTVYAPASVSIDGTNYLITPSTTEGPQTITISGLDLTGSDATVQFFQSLANNGDVAMEIGQVSFTGTLVASAIPEPGSAFLMGGGLLAGWTALKLRRWNRG